MKNIIKELRELRADLSVEQLIAEQRSEQDKSQAFMYAYKLLDSLISKYDKEL